MRTVTLKHKSSAFQIRAVEVEPGKYFVKFSQLLIEPETAFPTQPVAPPMEFAGMTTTAHDGASGVVGTAEEWAKLHLIAPEDD